MSLARAALSCLLCVSFPILTSATTIRAVSVAEMLEQSELVFEGRVSSIEVRGGEDPASIHTCAQFEPIEVLKGPAVGKSIELCFAGGTKGGFRRRIEGMIYPRPGENGIYFVKSLTEHYVSPFYGWQQGHFRAVDTENRGAPRVEVADGRSVVSIDRTSPWADGLSDGVARGVRVLSRRGSGQERPITLKNFKAKLRQMLGRLR